MSIASSPKQDDVLPPKACHLPNLQNYSIANAYETEAIFSYSCCCSEIKIQAIAWGIVKMKPDPKQTSLGLLSMINTLSYYRSLITTLRLNSFLCPWPLSLQA